MKKFGFSRKGDEGEDPNRSALFSRSKKSSPAPSDNPYAQQKSAPNDPYADTAKYANVTPYQQARAQLPSEPRTQKPGAGHHSPQPAQPAGYGSDRYGSGGGYGANRYDNQNSGPGQYNSPAAGARGPGGYGGFGGPPGSNEPDENRDALFSGAQARNAAQRQQQRVPPTSAPNAYGQPGAAPGGGTDASYGDYGQQRELTAEEQEEADVQAILQEKRQVQQDSADSLARSEQMAQQATEVGRATLARLGAQGERLYNTEMHLNVAANQNKAAQQKTAELKTLNRSMFAVHVGNPFTSKARQQRADDEIIERHQTEREEREATRRANYASTQRMESSFKDVERSGRQQQQQQPARKKDYGKFNLDDEDEGANELEDQIDDRIDRLGNHVGTMNVIGRAIGAEVDSQNNQLNRIMAQSDRVSDATELNKARLGRIK